MVSITNIEKAVKRGLPAALATAVLLFGLAGTSLAGIEATKHNLGSSGTANKTTGTGEICVFCHTPSRCRHRCRSAAVEPGAAQSDEVFSIAFAPDGTTWVGSYGGVARFYEDLKAP